MTLLSRVGTAIQNTFGPNGTLYSARVLVPAGTLAENDRERFAALRAYRDNNRLYDELSAALRVAGINKEAMKGLRNPTNAAVEFYAANLWPGTLRDALPLEFPPTASNTETDSDAEAVTSTDALTAAIHQVWQWSNWNANKQLFARDLATLGEQWIKVATRSKPDENGQETVTSVYFDLIQPEHVIEFDKDERDFLTFIRLDIPRTRRVDGKTTQYIHTEVWDKADGTYRVWEHNLDGRSIDQLGTPDVEEDISAFGIDFLPFVHCKFIDDGDARGRALIEPALDKIDEANRMATRLHQMLFNYGAPDKQLTSALTDPDGLPMAPPVDAADSNSSVMTISGTRFWKLPSGWRIEDILSDVNFQAHLDALNAMYEHLQQTDLPELIWYQIADAPELSGKAIRLMLTAPIAKAVEVRGNAEAALIRANQMALSLGIENGLFEASLGTFENGDFEHWFEERGIVPLSEEEQAAIDKVKAETAVLRASLGYPSDRTLVDLGLTEAEVKELQAAQAGSAATLDDSEQRQFDRGFVAD